ncbi:DUF3802 family protein [Motilimonas eburnea]|uniref:DUF3802 family protein n=1 Tax=Motilimonas eburnea TaxID=1737488 RepID=UPI001E36ABED|nr:DUF3802 family protein [Motilimonas eburnea]MCE2572457.1 DUF3802 family protein [Motilimonas eburnea]
MVIDSEGYIQLIHFLTDNLSLFENKPCPSNEGSVAEYVSDLIAENVMKVCIQHEHLDSTHRFEVVRETDAIVHDLEEVLSAVWHQAPTSQQKEFLTEFVGLIKNLFDTELTKFD